MIVRPYGIILDGALEVGLEAVFEEGRLLEVRPHTGLPEPFLLSPAFVNAHSHMEYRGFQGVIQEREYWPWIRELTRLKANQSHQDVAEDCLRAAGENQDTGVWFVEEHCDRPGSGSAMRSIGLRGDLYQELITFFEHASPGDKIAQVELRARENSPSAVNPHASYTVDPATLKSFAGKAISIHVAETEAENQFFREGEGVIADFHRQHGIPFEPTGLSAIATLDAWGLATERAQFVHCCAASPSDLQTLAAKRVRVAHCPRSNATLSCPPAPVREMLDLGIKVGLGMDSPASGGPIDMFAEMRAALATSFHRGKPLKAGEVWRMATGNATFGETPILKLHLTGCDHTDGAIESGDPSKVAWLKT